MFSKLPAIAPAAVKGVSALALAVCIAGLSSQASRADVRYDVSGVFTDGASVSGYFELDVYGFATTWDLTTTAGPGFPTVYEYTPSTSYKGGGGAATYVNFSRAIPIAYDGALQFGFSSPLAGYGPQPLVTGAGGPSWETAGFVSTEGVPPDPVRYLESGTVTGVPEVPTWAMMILGGGLLAYGPVFVRNRRERRAI